MKEYSTTFLKRVLFLAVLVAGILSTPTAVSGFSLPHERNLDEITVKGTVTDGEVTLIGVSIIVKGTSIGTVTDADGNFEIIAPGPDEVLVFSYIGYTTVEVPINGRSEITLKMESSSSVLDEVVVIGYGEQSRTTLTTSVSKLDDRVLDNIPFSNAASALQGTVSGLRVQTTTGQPGSAPSVILRGGTSINDPNGASPLYIIDGVIRDNINDLNPNDIESLQVLKDAASTSIYGARGSNGVIIVTTKTGKFGESRISYNYSMGASNLAERYDLVNARDYLYYGRLGVAATGERHPERLSRLDLPVGYGIGNDLTNNTGFTPQYLTPENEHKLNEGWESMPDPIDPSQTIIFKNTDWQDVLFRTGITHDHYLSFSGGGENSSFDLGVGYQDNEGIGIGTGYQRFTGKLNGDLRVRDNVTIFGKVSFSNSKDESVYNTNQLFQRALGLPPTAKYTFEDGTFAPGQNRSIGNPAYHLNNLDRSRDLKRLTMVIGGNWEIVEGLTFEPYAAFYMSQERIDQFQKSYFNNATQFIDSRDAIGFFSDYQTQQYEGVLTYSKSFNNAHNFQVKGGVSYYNRGAYELEARGRGAASDLISTLNAAAEPTSVSSELTNQRIIGYFGRVTYDYQRKYLFSASARYDGASNLGDNNKWGFFPGVSAGWNVHREQFWDAMPDMVSTLKLRASYGVNGNLGNLSDFHAQGQYSVGQIYNGIAAVQNTRLANQDLQWEESKTFDFGFDLGILNNRINILFDFYRRETNNLLTNLDLPQNTGFSSILTNLGSLENKGVELDINANIINTQGGFQWDVGFNAAYNKNKILKLPENGNENNRIGGFEVFDPGSGKYIWVAGLQEGQAIGELYTYQKLGVYATDEEAAAGPIDLLVPGADKSKLGGDVIFLDVDGNGEIDTRDRVYAGNIYPDWTGGFSNFFSYKGFGLTIRTDFAIGHTIRNRTNATFMGQFQGDIGILNDIKNSWENQGDITDIPRYYWADQLAQNSQFRNGGPSDAAGNIFFNSDYHEKGDFINLREVTLSYNFAGLGFLEKIKIASIRIFATGNNLKYFTNYNGLMPEEGGLDNGRYPNPRVYTFGANVTF
ncbi:MAG: SusC/RagA family TonB-linked outer membrane protein [Saprospiraceae bacterium]|nr:MAG: SusC/RagA family TonB-linked outer membrane protein [Saprospiraceae bacterium]